MNLLRWFRLLLTLRVDGNDDEGADPPSSAEPGADPSGESPAADPVDDPAEDQSLDSFFDGVTEAPEPKKDDRAAQLERELADERAARRALESRQTPQVSRDPQYEAEERALAEAKATGDQRYIANVEWQVQSSRRIRESEARSQEALNRAADTEDRAAFRSLRDKNPKTFDKYQPEVEKMAQEMRQRGVQPNRELLLTMMIGRAALDGKLKPKMMKPTPAPKPAPAAPAPQSQIDRGSPRGTRSDMTSRNRQTEREARYNRIKDVPL